MEIVAIRPPLVYGPGVKANFASLMRLAQRGMPLPFGRVANKRSLVFVGNLTDFIILCTSHPEAANRTFLVSDGDDLSIGELVTALSQGMHRKARLLPVPPRLMEITARLLGKGAAAQRLLGSLQLDITKTQRVTGWTPPFSAHRGLALTAEAFLKQTPTGR
jgi:UDP-glucose 4-epimerase